MNLYQQAQTLFFAFLACSLSTYAQGSSQTLLAFDKTHKTAVVEVESFVVKRFAEVVNTAVESEPEDLQEKLINLRARLAIADRELEMLEKPAAAKTDASDANESDSSIKSLPRASLIRAAKARADHFRHQVARLENKVVNEGRKERDKEARKKSKQVRSVKKSKLK